MTPEDLERELSGRIIRPVYLLIGAEEFLRKRSLSLLMGLLDRNSMDLNYARYSARDTPIDTVLAAANTFPMMSRMRMVLLMDLESLDEAEQEPLLAYVRHPSARTILVLSAADLDRRTGFYKSLREHSSIIEVVTPKGAAMERWTESWIRSRGYRISPSGLRKLIDLAGSDLQSLANEIEKLLIFCGERKSIPDAAAEELVRGSRQHRVFEMTDALDRGDRARSLQSLTNLLDLGEHPLKVLSMLARHFRQILTVKDLLRAGKGVNEIASAAQIQSFVLDTFLRQARRMDQTCAERTFLLLAEADLRFKSSSAGDERIYLERVICSL